jgi:hypothetical protein
MTPLMSVLHPERMRDARHKHLATPVVNTAMAVPFRPPATEPRACGRWEPLPCPRAWVPITTAGDRAGCYGQGRACGTPNWAHRSHVPEEHEPRR